MDVSDPEPLMPGKLMTDRPEPLATTVEVTDEEIIARLADGRTIRVPLAWSRRLSDATPEQRTNFRIIGAGEGIHWPEVDEDISVRSMLEGPRSAEQRRIVDERLAEHRRDPSAAVPWEEVRERLRSDLDS